MIWEILDTLTICTLRWLEGQMLYFDCSTIDSLLLCYVVYHIFMLMLFWDDSRSMMISSYLVFGHIPDSIMWWILCYGYLLHSCLFMLYANVSDVNGLFRYNWINGQINYLMYLLLWLWYYMQLHLIVCFSVEELHPWQWHMELVIQLFILPMPSLYGWCIFIAIV